MARKSKILEDLKNVFMTEDDFIENIETLEPEIELIQKINSYATYIVDERNLGYVLHSVESVLLLIIFAMIANCNTFLEIYCFGCKHYKWLNKYINFDNGMPSLSTIKRVISFINTKELETMLVNAVRSFNSTNEPIYKMGFFEIDDIYSTDGKTANASGRRDSKNGKVTKTNAMSLYSLKCGMCGCTEFISDKSNEIPTGKTLLKQVNIHNKLITFDALNTQKDIISYIFSNEGFYVAPIKGNHKILFGQLTDYFNDSDFLNKVNNENYRKTVEKRNGDADIREYAFTNDVSWIYGKEEWKGLMSVGYAKRTYRNEKGEIVTDIRYYISNLSAKHIDALIMAIRGEWKIENNLHYYLDMVFKEDDSKAFVENTQKNLNIIRKFCLALLKNYKAKVNLSMPIIRHIISMDFENEILKILKI